MVMRHPKKDPVEGTDVGNKCCAYVRRNRPWFKWRTCCKCQNEFRREYMWIVEVNYRRKFLSKDSQVMLKSADVMADCFYLCTKCSTNRRSAREWFYENVRDLYYPTSWYIIERN